MVRLLRVCLISGLLASAFGAAPAAGAVRASIQDGTLTIAGDGADDTIAISPSADTTHLDVDTDGDGTPDLSFDRSAFDHTVVIAGAGNDTITTAGDTSADDVSIDGGPGDDTMHGGAGGQLIHGGTGDDTVMWNPGDGNDTVEGDDGVDRFVMSGANVNEQFAVSANGSRVRVTRDVANIAQDIAGIEVIDLRLLGGDDTYTGGTGLVGLVSSIIVNGGAGKDTLLGGDANETLSGGPDPGGLNTDTVQGGAGDDTFPVSSLEPAEAVDGGEGTDTLAVTGTDAADMFTIGSPGTGQASVMQNFSLTPFASGADIERVSVDALGGNDSVAPTPAAATELSFDLSGGPGDDTLTGGQLPDTLRGGGGNDTLRAGGGDDQLFGDLGNDVLAGQAGADHFHCAGPTDTLDATAEDSVDPDCVPTPAPPVVVPDLTPPKLTITGLPKRIRRGTLLRRGLLFTVQPNEMAALQADLLGRTRNATLAAGTPNLTLASRTVGLSTSARRIHLRPSRRLIGRSKRFTLTVRIVASDASLNRSTTTRTVRVR